MHELLFQIFGEDSGKAGLIIFNLIIIESLLSVDNAAVLATMVMDLPRKLRNKALKYGIIGAYVFRGICLSFAAFLVQFLWLKAIGGLYLLWITYNHFFNKGEADSELEEKINKRENWVHKLTKGALGIFWSTVVLVEVMDLAFSIDNIFAAVAITKNVYLICIGVFIGILAMRFIAQSFVKLMEKFPFLENVSFVIIGILGCKLLVSSFLDYFGNDSLKAIFNGDGADMVFSLITASCFLLPLLSSYLFNFPNKNKLVNEGIEADT